MTNKPFYDDIWYVTGEQEYEIERTADHLVKMSLMIGFVQNGCSENIENMRMRFVVVENLQKKSFPIEKNAKQGAVFSHHLAPWGPVSIGKVDVKNLGDHSF